MILDGTGKDKQVFDADVCVVGAGAAGITLALDLAKRGLRVVLVESGGLTFSEQAHGLLDIEHMGENKIDLASNTRARYFGGTTNLWGGVCLPLDPYEFEQHDWVPHSGWPFSRKDLDPYYQAAADLLGLKSVEAKFDPEAMGASDRLPLINSEQEAINHTFLRRIPKKHLRVGRWRRQEVASNPLIKCLLNTTIVEIHPDKSHRKIAHLEGRTFNGDTLRFRARDYALCTSAIENARLLLASDSVVRGGLGNTHDLVGRFFMIHPPTGIGRILPLDPKAPLSQEEFLSNKTGVGWQISHQARKQFQLQAFHAFLIKSDFPHPLHHEAAVRELMHSPTTPDEDPASLRRRGFLVNWEQAPNPRSRIMLSRSRDELGVRKPLVNLELTADDRPRAQASFELLSLSAARSGLGRLQISDITTTPLTGGGGHQIGTTRMSDDPRQGVTDANGKVHSLDNLFVAGSSLFPTGGWQNPTFTIFALALRLAEFLHSRNKTA